MFDLNELSPEEIVGLAYELQGEMEKEASEAETEIDLNDLSVDEFIELAAYLEEDMSKEASADIDLNQLSADEIVELGYYLADDMEKEASDNDVDLNDLSVDEFIELAAYLEEDMEKEAAGVIPVPNKELLMKMLRRGGSNLKDVAAGGQMRRGYGDLKKLLGKPGANPLDARRIMSKDTLRAAQRGAVGDMAMGAAKSGTMYGGGAVGLEALRRKMMKKKRK